MEKKNGGSVANYFKIFLTCVTDPSNYAVRNIWTIALEEKNELLFTLLQNHQDFVATCYFFIRLEANQSEYGLIRFIFTFFGKFTYTIYSHHSLIFASKYRTNSLTNIRFDAKQIHVKANIHFRANACSNIFSYWQICASKYSFWSEYSQKFKQISHSSNYLLADIHIQANIRLQIFIYKRIFATYCFKSYRKAFQKS